IVVGAHSVRLLSAARVGLSPRRVELCLPPHAWHGTVAHGAARVDCDPGASGHRCVDRRPAALERSPLARHRSMALGALWLERDHLWLAERAHDRSLYDRRWRWHTGVGSAVVLHRVAVFSKRHSVGPTELGQRPARGLASGRCALASGVAVWPLYDAIVWHGIVGDDACACGAGRSAAGDFGAVRNRICRDISEGTLRSGALWRGGPGDRRCSRDQGLVKSAAGG